MKSKLTQSDIQILINNLNLKKYDLVITKSKNFIKKYPREIIFYNLLGISYQRTGKLIESKDIFLKGLKQSPKDISLKNNLAQTYTKLFEYEKAEQIYNELIKIKPEYASAYLNLGNQKRDLNQLHDAIKLYEVANKLMPNNHIILYAIALTHRALGNFDDAVKYSKQIIDLNPKFTKADLLISRCITYDKNNWHYKNLIEKTKNRNLTEDEDIDLCYSLSKANEDLKNISQSYEFLKIGNSLRKKRSNYNVRDDIDLINNIENAIIATLAEFNITANTDHSIGRGVFVGKKKIAFVGLKIKNKCSYHGFSLNIDNDLSPYKNINPCGITDLQLTTVKEHLPSFNKRQITVKMLEYLCDYFGYNNNQVTMRTL